MRILLLGEYSNVHATLAEGLRKLGHEVVVASNGDFWKNYPRDIDLARQKGRLGGLKLWLKLKWEMRHFRDFDIVQLINPLFVELKANKLHLIYNTLACNNKRIIMGSFGMDYYWVKRSDEMIFRYGDFNIGSEKRNDAEAESARKEWIGTDKESLNRYIAESCDAIVSGLYEYDECYRPLFPGKTTFIPFPIKPHTEQELSPVRNDGKVRIFVGISKARSAYKGTDIMLKAAQALKDKYPDVVDLQVAEGVPFEQYCQMMDSSDIILDQLYSYTPAMNALEAMSRGIICVGGGEPENYDILGEEQLRPIINVLPDYQHVYDPLEDIILHPERIPQLKRDSVEYIKRHHDYLKVALQYEKLYLSLVDR